MRNTPPGPRSHIKRPVPVRPGEGIYVTINFLYDLTFCVDWRLGAMRSGVLTLITAFLLTLAAGASYQDPASDPHGDPPLNHQLFDRVIENQKKNDHALDLYERVERVELRRLSGESQSTDVKISRVVPAGTGMDHLTLGPDLKPKDAAAYRVELEKLEKALSWAAESGRGQKDAYDKIARKKKERDDLIGAAKNAFIFTFLARESRDSRTLLKYSMVPNPAFHPTSRATSIYTRVKGTLWIDEASAEMARLEGEVTDDISVGTFLAKVYKGSHFMQERYEMVPGLWLPTFSQYDFDGRRLFVGFSLHERTFYSQYRYIGPPKDALMAIRAELSGYRAPPANP